MKKLITNPPFENNSTSIVKKGFWPANWITSPDGQQGPVVMLFKLVVESTESRSLLIHVSADERYILSVNGREEGRGSERGSVNYWFFETYQIELQAGENTILAKVWAAGETLSPFAQLSKSPGFLLATEDSEFNLSTGIADWQVMVQSGYDFIPAKICWGRGFFFELDGREIDWDAENALGAAWRKPLVLEQALNESQASEYDINCRRLRPAMLPAMKMIKQNQSGIRYAGVSQSTQLDMSQHDSFMAGEWDKLLAADKPVVIPPESALDIVIDFDNYLCAYNSITVSGGKDSTVSLLWAESFFEDKQYKGNRDKIDQKLFIGEGNKFIFDGSSKRRYDGLWWHAGRYLKVLIETGPQALIVESLHITETGYPLEQASEINFSDPELNRIIPIMFRGLQMCSHETLMDCPYYEQMMYSGDTRLELLTIYTSTNDTLLPRKAITCLNNSRDANGRIASRFPSKVRQLIPGFDLIWVAMVYDNALWCDDKDFITGLMPGVRMTIECFLQNLDGRNLLQTPSGWNFMDWVPGWPHGIPPVADDGTCGSLNWLFVYILNLAAQLETWLGEIDAANRLRSKAGKIAGAIRKHFWSEAHAMFADDTDKQFFSEHTQSLAVLSGQLAPDQARKILLNAWLSPETAKTTIYFSHYLFEAAYMLKIPEIIFARLKQDWFILPEMGFKTTYETPLPTRSDCHAWGAHPLYHYYASIIGARPQALGSPEMSIHPLPGHLEWFKAVLPSRHGPLQLQGQQQDNAFILKKGRQLPIEESKTV